MRFVVVAALAGAAMLGACAQERAELTGTALVERGQYLTEAVAGCNDCHTPMTPQGPDMTRSLQGAPLIFAPTIDMPWAPVAPPLAGIPGHYTEEQFAAFLQTGVRPDGSRPLPPMPHFRFNEEDARAVTAYIATLPEAGAETATP
jgi:mono/diheme cytochrome c family protein